MPSTVFAPSSRLLATLHTVSISHCHPAYMPFAIPEQMLLPTLYHPWLLTISIAFCILSVMLRRASSNPELITDFTEDILPLIVL